MFIGIPFDFLHLYVCEWETLLVLIFYLRFFGMTGIVDTWLYDFLFYIASPYFKIWSNSVVFAFMYEVWESFGFNSHALVHLKNAHLQSVLQCLALSQFVFPLERFQLHHFRGQAGFNMQALHEVCTYIAIVTNEAWKSAVSILFCASWMRHIQDMLDDFWKSYWDEFDEIDSRSSQNLTSPIDRSKVDCHGSYYGSYYGIAIKQCMEMERSLEDVSSLLGSLVLRGGLVSWCSHQKWWTIMKHQHIYHQHPSTMYQWHIKEWSMHALINFWIPFR